MGNISTEIIANVVNKASEGLVTRTLGGVTKESASKAIQTAADNVKNIADKEIGTVQRELNQLRYDSNLTAQKLAEKTSEHDNFVLQAANEKQALENQITSLKERITRVLRPRTGKPKVLPNGNTQTIKTNLNGATMTVETLPNGKKVSVTVRNIDGDVRKTFYDPATGKPMKTFTNTNGDKLIEYKDGKSLTTKNVNNKKVKPQKPQVVNTEVIKSDIYGRQTIRKSYSDGSYELIEYSASKNRPVSSVKMDNNNLLSEQQNYYYKENDNLVETLKYEAGRSHSPIEKIQEYTDKNITKVTKYDKKGFTTEVNILRKGGKTTIIKAQKDDYGNRIASKATIRHIFPKGSKIKTSDIRELEHYRVEETLHLKDGRIAVLKTNNNYNVTYAQVYEKGSKTPVEIDYTMGNKLKEFLQDIGYEGFTTDHNYFYNYI